MHLKTDSLAAPLKLTKYYAVTAVRYIQKTFCRSPNLP